MRRTVTTRQTHDTHRQDPLQTPSQDRRKAIRYRIPVPHSDQDTLYYVKANEHHREDETFVQDRIYERLMVKPRSKVKMLADKQDLCENERVDNCEGVFRIIQMPLRQNEALVD